MSKVQFQGEIMNKEKIYQSLIELTNRKWLSMLIRKYATSKVSKRMIPFYQKHFKIDGEVFQPPKNGYQSLHEFFIRDVKHGMRPICMEPDTVISPVDGVIEDFGSIGAENCIYAKQRAYLLEDLLQNDAQVQRFSNGFYMVIYLSPSHYHKIHCPFGGEVSHISVLGERSYPVNQMGLKYGKKPLSHNYRVISEISYGYHSFVVAKIGAMFVNTITMTNSQMSLKKGDELAYFSFGSTVILLFEPNQLIVDDKIHHGKSVFMGQSIGKIKQL